LNVKGSDRQVPMFGRPAPCPEPNFTEILLLMTWERSAFRACDWLSELLVDLRQELIDTFADADHPDDIARNQACV
jgi:hypothetical protein